MELMTDPRLETWLAAYQARQGQGIPLPNDLRERFAPYFPVALLDKVRLEPFTAADYAEHPADIGMFTCGYVIVWNPKHRGDTEAWAADLFHELIHVAQWDVQGPVGYLTQVLRYVDAGGDDYTSPHELVAYTLSYRFEHCPPFDAMAAVRLTAHLSLVQPNGDTP